MNQRFVWGNKSFARELSGNVQFLDVPSERILIDQGADDNDIYFILAGRFEIVINGRKIAMSGPGEHVGEIAAILPSLRRSATVRAAEDGRVAKLNGIIVMWPKLVRDRKEPRPRPE